ncbi:MAG: phosphotransferase [Gammaproteobacteria bacterium]|nr:phosphotransferase [Gammaproteobacteria bacterium]
MSDRMQALRAWLDRVVGARADALEPASTDASFRRYFRVRVGADSLIVMDAPPGKEDCRRYVHVASLLREAGVKVPEVLAADLELGFLLLTDFGSTPYLAALDENTVDRLYGEALDTLLLMQTRASAAGLPEYDDGRLLAEMALFPQWLLRAHLGLSLDSVQDAVLQGAFELLCRSAAEQPRVFVHRDYHSRNLMVLNGGHPGILDFQDAVRGPLTYDLLSLLRDVYVCWPRERVRAWVCGYRERLIAAGTLDASHGDRFQRWFDLMGVQRHLKIAGIFARLYHRDGKPVYLRDIPLTLDYLGEECAPYPELGPLADLVEALAVRARVAARNADIFGE